MRELPSGKITDLRGQKKGLIYVEEFSHIDDKLGAIWYCTYKSGRGALIATRLLNGDTFTGFKYLPPIERTARSLRGSYRRIAEKQRNMRFDISPYKFRQLTSQDCFYCGKPPEQEFKNKAKEPTTYLYNGLDRVDNTKGYYLDNVVPACGTCNEMKSKMTLENFKEKIEKIYHNIGV